MVGRGPWAIRGFIMSSEMKTLSNAVIAIADLFSKPAPEKPPLIKFGLSESRKFPPVTAQDFLGRFPPSDARVPWAKELPANA